jgi:hypothetical protein
MQFVFEWDIQKAIMKKEYDFTKDQRGRFYRPDATFNLPVYLDNDNRAFIEKMARNKHLDVSTVVNQLIRSQAQTPAGPGI